MIRHSPSFPHIQMPNPYSHWTSDRQDLPYFPPLHWHEPMPMFAGKYAKIGRYAPIFFAIYSISARNVLTLECYE